MSAAIRGKKSASPTRNEPTSPQGEVSKWLVAGTDAMRRLLMLLLAASLVLPGCLDEITSFTEEDDIVDSIPLDVMSSDAVNEFLQEGTNLDPTTMASGMERFGVSMSIQTLEDGESGQVSIVIMKDDPAQIGSIGIGFTAGMMSMEVEQVTGAHRIGNMRVMNQWFTMRDEQPEYVDPFTQMAAEGGGVEGDIMIGNPMDEIPDPTGMFNEALAWTVTIDTASTQQVASASNETHQVIVEFQGVPPRIISIESYANNGSETVQIDYSYGAQVELSISESYPRTSVTIEIDDDVNFTCDNGDTILMSWVNDDWDDCGDNSDEGVSAVTIQQGEVSDEHTQEVLLSEIELRIGEGDEDEFYYNISMMLDAGSTNVTDASGDWWNITWADVDGDGLVSAGDTHSVLTNSSAADDFEVLFYDHWADQYAGGPLPGFELLLVAGALISAAFTRRRAGLYENQ